MVRVLALLTRQFNEGLIGDGFYKTVTEKTYAPTPEAVAALAAAGLVEFVGA